MSGIGSPLAIVVLLGFAAQSRPTVADVPAIDRQREHFYQALAVGRKGVEATWLVAPETVPLDGEFTLTLIIANAANPTELLKPPLEKLEAFTKIFQVFSDPDPPVSPTATEVHFRYRLRPRSLEVTGIPALRYLYYRPESGQFLTTFARGVSVVVTPLQLKSVLTVPPVPLEVPEEFFAWDSSNEFHVPRYLWLAPLALVPVVVVGWVLAWREFIPNAARQALRLRSLAARRALEQLPRAHLDPDPPEFVANVVREYLAARFGIPEGVRTPREVAAALRLAHQPEGRTVATEVFFRACDAARFSAERKPAVNLIERAEWLVDSWELVRG